jgi:hypothetical protein
MRSHHAHIRLLVAAAAILLATAIGPAAAANPAAAESAAPPSFVPGVTDSTTGVLRELRLEGDVDASPFVAGVTDSTTGVLRALERQGHRPEAAPADYGDAGAGAALAAAAGAGLLATLVAASLFLTVERRRRLAL